MGYFRHDAVIAAFSCAYKQEEVSLEINNLREEMRNDTLLTDGNIEHRADKLLIGPVGQMNSYSFYAFLPDGSKEGWDYSTRIDRYRDKFIAIMMKDKYVDMVHISFGGDGYEANICLDTNGER